MIKRFNEEQIKVPFEKTDPEYGYLCSEIVTQQKVIEGLEKQFKKPLSEAKEKLADAIKGLAAGKEAVKKCLLFIDVEKNLVKTWCHDTKEWLPDRECEEEDKVPYIQDIVVKSIPKNMLEKTDD
jgi:hypothetical protein